MSKKKLDSNPFIAGLKIESMSVVQPNSAKVVPGMGVQPVWYPVEYDREAVPKVTLYKSVDLRKAIAALSERSKGMFLWIMYKVEEGEDMVYLDIDKYNKELCGESGSDGGSKTLIGRNTFYNVIKELRCARVIAPCIKHKWYWINPEYFFCGSRIKKYPENVVYKKGFEPKYRDIKAKQL